MNVTAPEWAIKIALERVNEYDNYIDRPWSTAMVITYAKGNNRYACTVILLAEMIARYEPHLEPSDPLLEEARKIAADNSGYPQSKEKYLSGVRDHSPLVGAALSGLRRGQELSQ